MIKTFGLLLKVILILFYFVGGKLNAQEYDRSIEYLRENFSSPPSEYGVNCWWWWLNGNVDKNAITKDLEAMKSRNFHGAMIFDAGGHNQRGNVDIPSGPLFGNDAWNELFVFALDEAERLDLEIGFNIQSGWNLGGPRVMPEHAAKQLTYSEIRVNKKRNREIVLEQPFTRKGYYKDVVVLAFPIHESQKAPEPIFDLDYKLAVHELGGSAPDSRFLLENNPRIQKKLPSDAYIINPEDVKDVSKYMNEEGRLEWEVPDGEWALIRIGYTCTDAEVSTSSGEWQGNVLDYMSREAFEFYWEDVVSPILEASGHHVGKTLKYMETDSWECGGMNWTRDFPEEFAKYRDYELLKYLPIVAGYVVKDMDTSLSFLADFRKTIGDLVAYNHYAVFQEYAHKYGMGIQPESAGPHAGPMDGIKNYGFSDIVMTEFWSPSPHRPNPNNRFFVKQASSAAHILGKRIVGAESFTTIGPHWNDELWQDQKPAFDQGICSGLNRIYFHTFTSSPSKMGFPGQEYFAGTHINPQVTWWDQSGSFIDYMHRVQLMVQNGDFVADVLYYYGDHVPNIFPYKYTDPAGAMFGFDYDVTDESALMQLKVKGKQVIVPSGLSYKLLVLPDHEVLSLRALEKVNLLLESGATVLGSKPEKMVSLVKGNEGEARFVELVDKIWGKAEASKGERGVGKGTIAWGWSSKDYLLSKDVATDFRVLENIDGNIDYIHYMVDDEDVYFVINQSPAFQKFTAEFRVDGKRPEFWDPLEGKSWEAEVFSQRNGLTSLPISLEPYEALFVVFANAGSTDFMSNEAKNFKDYQKVQELKGEWNLNFNTDFKGVGEIKVSELFDWSSHSDPKIKYYSGPVVYTKEFELEFGPIESGNYYLELNNVKDVGIAEVSINGLNKGVVWTKPFRVEVTNELQTGKNIIEIKVVNSWYNRVAGEELGKVDDPYTNTNIRLINDYKGRPRETIPLEPSGLLGPVEILIGQ
ncbi:glycosyl hydrolase [Echinicola shivajiensis]|uniref:glycosyl hydrolase n=1 Tax=Echinicola shivajiensis TaxID=1035916 RepID=UPI001BFC9760|nr:glycosyl hydrolase [Echinicola shivajiensis]